ncbi:hypothetical protein COOONC_00124 [Cooperia oncophora]
MVGNLQVPHERLRHRPNAEWRGISMAGRSNERILPLPFPCIIYKPQEGDPISIVRQYAVERANLNITFSERRGMKEVRGRLNVSDKEGEFVVLKQGLDRAITNLHLDNTLHNIASTEKQPYKQCRRLKKIWTDVARIAGLPRTTNNSIRCDRPVCPVFCVPIKTHKLTQSELSSEHLAVSRLDL